MVHSDSLVAIDVGNSRIKLGRFARPLQAMAGLPEPAEVLALAPSEPGRNFDLAPLADWLAEYVPAGSPFVVGSVSRPGTQVVSQFLSEYGNGGWDQVRVLSGSEIAIPNLTVEPDRVGIDRLAAAKAGNAIRRTETPMIVVDFGTAITVDLITSNGEFAGGAILPGIGTAASALHAGTDALPEVHLMLEGRSPDAVGQNTTEAIRAGVYWGAVGAIRELIARQRDRLVKPPQVLVTGSVSPDMARLLGSPEYTVRYVRHLVLAGIAIAGDQPL